MERFFLRNEQELFKRDTTKSDVYDYIWLISSDQIFSSNIDGFKEWAKIRHIDFMIYKSFLFEETKTAEVSVYAKEVHVYMLAGTHCAMLEGRMAKNIIIPKISIQKISSIHNKKNVLENKEFQQCVIHSFGMQDDIVGFSFRYRSFKDEYTDYNRDGTLIGKAAAQIDLAKWEIKES